MAIERGHGVWCVAGGRHGSVSRSPGFLPGFLGGLHQVPWLNL